MSFFHERNLSSKLAQIATVTFCCAFLTTSLTAQVPSQYQDLYTATQASLNSFSQTLQSQANSARYPVLYAAQLLSASSENGALLLNPNYQNHVLTELTQLQAVGIKAIDLNINFPTLFPAYYTDSTQCQQTLNFYTWLATEIRARGLKLIVETQVLEPNPAISGQGKNSYVQSLTWSQYQAGRAQTAATIVQYLRPDYMTLVTEPDTESVMSGQKQVNSVSGVTQLVNTMLAAVGKNGATVLGVGVGTWHPQLTSFINAYASMPISFIDIHVYPSNKNFLQNAIIAADMAHKANKGITMSEAWLNKVTDAELGSISVTAVSSRNAFGFWQPLDSQFLKLMVELANYKQFEFISPFWSNYFSAYIAATDTSGLNGAFQAAGAAMQQGSFTPAAAAYQQAILPSPDKTAPSVPAPPAVSRNSTGAFLSWNATYDNVGVAAYRVYRNGVLIGTTSSTTYMDWNATRGATYSYQLSAFDAAGNVSPQSAITKSFYK